MATISIIATAGLIAVLALAAWSDLRQRRIPNALTVAALLLALALRSLLGSGSLVDGLLGAGVAMAVLVPLFALGGFGGGDAKLLIALGAFFGPKGFFVALLATALAGGAMSLVQAARRGLLLPVLLNTSGLLRYVFTLGHAGERTTRGTPGAVDVPYALAIAAGALFAIWYGVGP